MIYQPSIVSGNSVNLYSDASKLGYGGCYGSQWIQGTWPSEWKIKNIAVLELFPILLLMVMFGHKMANSQILIHCDNIAIVHVINKQTSKNKEIMALLRPLVLKLLTYNIRFRAQHISTTENNVADAISRFQETPSLLRQAGLRQMQTQVPQEWTPGIFQL